MVKKFVSLFVVSFLGLPAWGIAQGPMTLQQCVDYALVNHPDIKLAQLSVLDADRQIKESSAIAYPQANLGVNVQRFLQVPAIPAEALGLGDQGKFRFSLENNFAASLTVSQILINFPYFKSVKAAREFKTLVQLQMNSVREDVANRVRDAYLPALLITETVAVLDKDIALQEKLANETRLTLAAGFVEQIDVDRLDLIVGTLKTERENLVRQRDILTDALKFTMGYPVLDALVLADNMDRLMADISDIDPDERLDYMNRPDYQVVLKARELRQIQVDAAKADWMPTLNAFGSYNPTLQGNGNEKLYFIPSAIVGLQLSMPIYDGGYRRARRSRAEIDAMRVDEQRRYLVSGLDVEVEAARKTLLSTRVKMDDQQVNLNLATRIQDVTETKFRAGMASSFEVTQSYATLFSAQRTMLQARYNYLAALMNWREALGKATPPVTNN